MNKVGKWLLVVLLVAAIGCAGYFYYRYSQVTGDLAQKEITALVKQLGTVMILPEETPTLATVTDSTKLNSQRFFRRAVNGDKVLIFPLASEAILYRPSIKKIIEVAAVQSTVPVATPTGNQVKQISASVVPIVAFYNGTTSTGATNKIEKMDKGKMSDVDSGIKESAANQDYQQTIVIDLSKKFTDRTGEIAKLLGAKVMAMPQGEIVPSADILVIVGKSSL